MQTKVVKRQAGRPRLGEYRLETVVPREVLNALKKCELETGQYRTRVAAYVLCEWARVNGFNAADGSQHQI